MLKLYLLGRPYVEIDGQAIQLSRRKNLALLAYLALANEPRARTALMALLWPDLDTHHAQTALRRDLWVLRNTLGERVLAVTNTTVGLVQQNAVFWSDVMAFQQLLSTHRAQRDDQERCDEAWIARLVAAVQLYRDEFMSGFALRDSAAFDEWQLAQTEVFRHDFVIALEALVKAYRRQRNIDLAISYAQRLLEADPLHEPAHEHLMALYAASGRYHTALQHFVRYTQLLADELGAPPSPAMCNLQREIATQLHPRVESVSPPEAASHAQRTNNSPNAPPTRPHAINLPKPPTPFVGRTNELRQVAEQLTTLRCRLLTILGPGGSGKSRLAIEAAHQLQHHYQDGVCFVSLAALRHIDLLPAAILEALGLRREANRSPTETLIAYLEPRHLLLVLDNFEQLRAGVPLIERLLESTERATLLVTTRERLNLAAEWLLPLAGMDYPPLPGVWEIPAKAVEQQERREQYDAIQLFMACAQRIRPSTVLNASNAGAIEQICRLVEGIPLAIELAAAWLSIMSCEEIAQALQHGLDILATTQHDVETRQRSMRTTLDYSWRLATPAEQLVLARLAVFHGGFVPSLAQVVADADPLMLRTLADKSWLHQLTAGRLVLHELVRQFCAEKLASGADDEQKILRRHARAYGAFLQQREVELLDQRQVEAVQAIVTEVENIRAAWGHAVATDDVDLLHALLESFCLTGMIRNWHQEMTTFLMQTASTLVQYGQESRGQPHLTETSRHLLVARLHLRLAFYLAELGHIDKATKHCNQSLEILLAKAGEGRTDPITYHELGFAHALHAHLLASSGNYAEALTKVDRANTYLSSTQETIAGVLAVLAEAQARFEMGEQAYAIALLTDKSTVLRERGELWLRTRLLNQLTFRLRIKNETALAQHYTEERMLLCQQLGDQVGVAYCLQDLSYIALFSREQDTQTARRHMEDALAISNTLHNPSLQGDVLFGLGQIVFFEEQWTEAQRHFEESYAIFHETHGQVGMTLNQLWLGEIALKQDKLAEAVQLFHAVLNQTKAIPVMLLGLEGLAKVCLRQAEIEPAVATLTMIEHHSNTWEYARQRIKQILQHVATTEPSASFIAAHNRGESMTISDALTWAQTMRAKR